LLAEVADSRLVAEAAESLAEISEVGDAPRRRERFAVAQCGERDVACLVGSPVSACASATTRRRRSRCGGTGHRTGRRLRGVGGGVAAVVEVAEAVAEFGGQLGFVEVADEFRVAAGVGVLEAAFCCG
jgi:hypothetical protein